MNGDIGAAMRGQAGPATLSAWNTNRSQNLPKLEDARSATQVRGANIQSLTSTFFAGFSALDFGGDD
jgi:hypothetical protein